MGVGGFLNTGINGKSLREILVRNGTRVKVRALRQRDGHIVLLNATQDRVEGVTCIHISNLNLTATSATLWRRMTDKGYTRPPENEETVAAAETPEGAAVE